MKRILWTLFIIALIAIIYSRGYDVGKNAGEQEGYDAGEGHVCDEIRSTSDSLWISVRASGICI
jgi:hypothetical protein